jgi:ketosteroid isomerase-like protein
MGRGQALRHAGIPFLRALSLVALVGAFGAGGCAGEGGSPRPQAGAGFDAAQAAFVAAMEARDAEALADLFVEDGIVQIAGMPEFRGRDAIGGLYRNLFGFLAETVPEPEPLRMAEGGGMAYGTGRVTNTFQGAEGPEQHQGKFVIIWRETAQGWRVAVYAVSSDR